MLEIVAAVRLRRLISNELALSIGGAPSVLFGIVLIVAPRADALAVVFLIGACAIIFGIALLGLARRLRQQHESLGSGPSLRGPATA